MFVSQLLLYLFYSYYNNCCITCQLLFSRKKGTKGEDARKQGHIGLQLSRTCSLVLKSASALGSIYEKPNLVSGIPYRAKLLTLLVGQRPLWDETGFNFSQMLLQSFVSEAFPEHGLPVRYACLPIRPCLLAVYHSLQRKMHCITITQSKNDPMVCP